MRNWTQDKIKYKTFNSLDPLEIYIHFDWAMKYMRKTEKLKYREKQQDFRHGRRFPQPIDQAIKFCTNWY